MTENVLQLIERGDLVDQVVDVIVDAIVTGQFRPGAKLVEMQIGEQLGVSRGPVREAFRRLEQMGLVAKVPYRGTFVSTLTVDDVRELHDLRAPLEGLAARLLAEKRDPADVERLASILEAMQHVPPSGDHTRTITLDADFHDTLIALTGHRMLQEIWPAIGVRLRSFLMLKRKRLYQTPNEAAALHTAIVEAIASGDSAAAEQAAYEHAVNAGRRHVNDWMNYPD
jgi:DNA-binding GntR family transcriptional regulator